MAYVDQKVIIVDFNIRDSKNYSFFINDELCEIKLERKKDQMHYHFEINQEADTPRNRARKKVERKYLKQAVIFVSALLIALVSVVIYFNSTLKTQKATVQLLQNPKEAIGRVKIKEEKGQKSISYFFVADSRSFNAKTEIPLNFKGMPIENDDEFLVEYSEKNPTVNKIRFNSPTKKQIEIYRNRVLEKHAYLHTELSKQHIQCLINIAYDLKGFTAFADFYFQKMSPEENSKHNQNTYLRLTRDLPFKNKVKKECW